MNSQSTDSQNHHETFHIDGVDTVLIWDKRHRCRGTWNRRKEQHAWIRVQDGTRTLVHPAKL